MSWSKLATTRLVRTAIERLLSERWYVDSQEPITLIDGEPEPDVVVVKGNTCQYLDRHPGAGDIALVIEVSDTTLQRDRTTKKRAYARSGIPIYWTVNLNESQVEVYTQPAPDQADYQQRQDYNHTDALSVLIDQIVVGEIAIATLLP